MKTTRQNDKRRGSTPKRALRRAVALLLSALPLLTATAQDRMVGDGFGGRKWFKPSNITSGVLYAGSMGAAVVKGQLYMWGGMQQYCVGPVPGGTTSTGNVTASSYPIVGLVNSTGEYLGRVSDYAAGLGYVNPYSVQGYTDVKLIALGDLSGLIKKDGTGWAWGKMNNINAFLGANTNATIHTPQKVMDDAYFVAGGPKHIVFVKKDGTVWSLGDNTYGSFGNGTTTPSYANTSGQTIPLTPVQMTGMTNAVRVAPAASDGTIILKRDGTVWLSGSGGLMVSTNPNTTATKVPGLANIVDIKAALNIGVALDSSGAVYTWGQGWNNLFGTGDYTVSGSPSGTRLSPQRVLFPPEAAPIVAIESDASAVTILALDENHVLWGWGGNGTNVIGGLFSRPVVVAKHVADMNLSGNSKPGIYVVRTTDYPKDERLWSVRAEPSVGYMFALNPMYGTIDPATTDYNPISPSSNYYVIQTVSKANGDDTRLIPANPGAWGAGFADIGQVETDGAGTIDCSKTQLSPAPVQGTASHTTLLLTVDVTTAGTFTPTVSGSGMSLVDAGFTITATATGVQTFHIPIKYDGSTLGSMTFGLSEISGTCTADLTKGPKNTITPIWTLDCVPTEGPDLK